MRRVEVDLAGRGSFLFVDAVQRVCVCVAIAIVVRRGFLGQLSRAARFNVIVERSFWLYGRQLGHRRLVV